MTQSSENRLDRIENILLSAATRLDQVSQQQQANTEAISQLTQRMEEGFAESRRQLQESASYLVGVIGDFVEELQEDRSQAEQDRAIIRGLQTENQRILQYLLGQRQDEGEA
jgi:dsDNA-specific endonuclease/ATPase MutS2